MPTEATLYDRKIIPSCAAAYIGIKLTSHLVIHFSNGLFGKEYDHAGAWENPAPSLLRPRLLETAGLHVLPGDSARGTVPPPSKDA